MLQVVLPPEVIAELDRLKNRKAVPQHLNTISTSSAAEQPLSDVARAARRVSHWLNETQKLGVDWLVGRASALSPSEQFELRQRFLAGGVLAGAASAGRPGGAGTMSPDDEILVTESCSFRPLPRC